jgi:hypothetical protein
MSQEIRGVGGPLCTHFLPCYTGINHVVTRRTICKRFSDSGVTHPSVGRRRVAGSSRQGAGPLAVLSAGVTCWLDIGCASKTDNTARRRRATPSTRGPALAVFECRSMSAVRRCQLATVPVTVPHRHPEPCNDSSATPGRVSRHLLAPGGFVAWRLRVLHAPSATASRGVLWERFPDARAGSRISERFEMRWRCRWLSFRSHPCVALHPPVRSPASNLERQSARRAHRRSRLDGLPVG